MRLPAFVQALRVREFRLLWSGAFLSSLGTWTQDVALAWLIHTRIGDPFYLGLRSFVADAPLVAFMLVGGAVADRVDRRLILLTSQFLQMAFAAVLAVLYVAGQLTVAPILLMAFLTGLAQSQSAPTYQAVLTTVVPPAQIPNAVALNSLQFNLSRMVGPVIAGLLLARGGTLSCFVFNVVSFLAVIVALWRIELPPPAAPAQKESLADSLRAGFRHVKDSPLLRTFTLLAAAASFFGFPLITYLPVIAGDVLHTGAKGFSYLLSSFGAGAIVGALVIAQRGQAKGRGRLLLLGFAAYGVATIGAVQSRHQWLSMTLLFAAGLCLVTGFSTLNSLVQENAPAALRGRVLSIFGFAFRGGLPIGALVSGLLVRQRSSRS
jgi:predicted MFS family arabinose efflux permease